MIDLARLAARASTLDERLSRAVLPDEPADTELVERRLEAWREALGGTEALERRLAWDRLSMEAARMALGNVRLPEDAPLPEWCATLTDALAIGPNEAARPMQGPPLPFHEAVEPFVIVARRRLEGMGAATAPLSDEAHSQLDRSLLALLSELAAPTLLRAFSADNANLRPPFRRLYDLSTAPQSRAFYERFVKLLRAGRLGDLLADSAALARSLATATDQWIETTAEFLERLKTDWSALQESLAPGAATVVRVRPRLSDSHNGGRTVAILEFDTGTRVVYKPKDLGAEAAFGDLLEWLNERGAMPPLFAPPLLRRRAYGWVAHVEHRSFRDRHDASQYFQRAGMLLAVLHLLEATDIHCENVVANSEGPVLLDLETLMHPRLEVGGAGAGGGAEAIAEERLAESVLRVGLLPVWDLSPDDLLAYEQAGLKGASGQEIPLVARRWEAVNTDEMHLRYVRGRSDAQENVPLLRGSRLSVEDYEDDIVAGYCRGHALLADHRCTLAAPGGPLEQLADEKVRCVFRSTIDYAGLLEEVCRPRHLHEGVDRSLRIELLAQTLAASPGGTLDHTPPAWPLIAAERRALERGDLPAFYASPRATAIAADDAVLGDCFEVPSLSFVLRRLEGLDAAGLEQQVDFIRGAFQAHGAHEVDARPDPPPRSGAFTDGALSDARLLREAEAIAESLIARAIIALDGTATWIGVQLIPRVNRFELEPISYALYDGALGISLFFAALARVDGDHRWRDHAFTAATAWRRALANPGARMKLSGAVGIGGAIGVGSFLYAGTTLARLLEAPDLLDEVEALAEALSPEVIAADRDLDVLSGSAGAILGLLALHKARPGGGALLRAEACGRRLVEARVASPSGKRAWPTSGGVLLTGFSHGAAGIAYALLRLSAATGNASLRDVAEEAIEYERTLYSVERSNWIDLRIPAAARNAFTARWCHGAPGIALARLGGLDMLATAAVVCDMEAGLRTSLAYDLTAVDNLCCGNLGRADILLTAGRTLNRFGLVAAARRLVSAVVERAVASGSYSVGRVGSPGTSPGLFTGLAGIGYQLLRTVAPEEIPSVLAFE